MAFIDGTVVNIAIPVLQRSLGATVSDAQWIVDAYLLVLSSLILAGGALGDQLGRRRVFGIGIALFAAASIACGAASSPRMLIIARASRASARRCSFRAAWPSSRRRSRPRSAAAPSAHGRR